MRQNLLILLEEGAVFCETSQTWFMLLHLRAESVAPGNAPFCRVSKQNLRIIHSSKKVADLTTVALMESTHQWHSQGCPLCRNSVISRECCIGRQRACNHRRHSFAPSLCIMTVTSGPVAGLGDEIDAVKLQQSESTPLLAAKQNEQETVDGVPRYESFGYMLLLLSALGFCFMGLAIRMATGYHDFPVPCVLFMRGVMQSVLALVWIFTFTDAKETFSLPRRVVGLLFLRGFGGGTSMALVFFGLSRVPLGISNSIFFLSTLDTSHCPMSKQTYI